MSEKELHEAAAKYARDAVGLWCDHPAFKDYKYLQSIRPHFAYSWDRDFAVQYAAFVAGYAKGLEQCVAKKGAGL